MIFSELYCAYYNAVAAIISRVLQGGCSERDLQQIAREHAFGESVLTIIPSLRSGKWQLIHEDMTTPLTHKPTMPLTALQKQWLKAVSLDPRVKLFNINFPELDGVEPLFTPEDYRVYDQYSDGDPYEDAEYIRQFRLVLQAIREKSQIKFEMKNRKGNTLFVRCRPLRLEYSEKDDKFRVITVGNRFVSTVNLARMRSCVPDYGKQQMCGGESEIKYETITVRILDERNALERFMLHFAHFEKQAEKLDEKHYLVKIKYDCRDESELVIRILSFGPMAEVIDSEAFRNLIIEKLKKQKSCGLK